MSERLLTPTCNSQPALDEAAGLLATLREAWAEIRRGAAGGGLSQGVGLSFGLGKPASVRVEPHHGRPLLRGPNPALISLVRVLQLALHAPLFHRPLAAMSTRSLLTPAGPLRAMAEAARANDWDRLSALEREAAELRETAAPAPMRPPTQPPLPSPPPRPDPGVPASNACWRWTPRSAPTPTLSSPAYASCSPAAARNARCATPTARSRPEPHTG